MNTKLLKQKILDLAIRGKLVPQDPNDEPASVLLERIRAEKERLVAEGKIKRSKSTTDNRHYENVPFEIPNSWEWCKVEDFAYVASGSTPEKSAFVDSGIPYLKMYNLKNQKIDFDFKPQYIKEEVHNGKLQRSRTEVGDLIMNIVGPPLGKLAIIPSSLPQCNFNQAAVLIRPIAFKDTLVKFLFYYLSQMSEINSISTKGTAGQVNISLTQAQNMRVPLPPLAEQTRIIQELEKWFGLIDEIETNKKDLQEAVKQIKSNILSLAISGKLVAQDPNDEPAIELLKRINPSFTPCNNSHYPNLPNHWTICNLLDIIELLDNKRKPIKAEERAKRIEGKSTLYPYYGATGFVGFIDQYLIDGRYILLGEDGAPFLDKFSTKAYEVKGKIWVNNHAHILSPKIDFDYLLYYLNAIDYAQYVKGTTRLKLTQGDMTKILVLVPPLNEQKRISQRVSEIYNILDAMTAEL